MTLDYRDIGFQVTTFLFPSYRNHPRHQVASLGPGQNRSHAMTDRVASFGRYLPMKVLGQERFVIATSGKNPPPISSCVSEVDLHTIQLPNL